MDKAGVAFLVLVCILVAIVVSILWFVPEEVPEDVPEVAPQRLEWRNGFDPMRWLAPSKPEGSGQSRPAPLSKLAPGYPPGLADGAGCVSSTS